MNTQELWVYDMNAIYKQMPVFSYDTQCVPGERINLKGKLSKPVPQSGRDQSDLNYVITLKVTSFFTVPVLSVARQIV